MEVRRTPRGRCSWARPAATGRYWSRYDGLEAGVPGGVAAHRGHLRVDPEVTTPARAYRGQLQASGIGFSRRGEETAVAPTRVQAVRGGAAHRRAGEARAFVLLSSGALGDEDG